MERGTYSQQGYNVTKRRGERLQVERLEKGGVLHEGQAGFRSCINNV